MAEASAYTAAEVAFVLREPVRSVKKALDQGPVQARLVRRAGGSVRAVDRIDLFYLFAVQRLRDELTPKARNEFYHALRGTEQRDVRQVSLGRLTIVIDDLLEEMEQRARELAALGEVVEFRKDGEAVLRGTTVEVHRIAALLDGGMTVDEILEDYPSLAADQVDKARAYAKAHPKAGRPYPARTAKRALANAGLEALDEILGTD